MVVGLICDISRVKELIDRIISEAEQIIRGRLTGFLDGPLGTKLTRAIASERRGRFAQQRRSRYEKRSQFARTIPEGE
ncbi:hypothetical protein ABIB66_007217 [Bradyrhizobium sp. F1.13.3]